MSNKVMIAPSILSADPMRMGDELDSVRDADYIHFDVMDGSFVPNVSYGPGMLAACVRHTEVPIDAHLMMRNPDNMVDPFIDAGAAVVTFHLEATNHAHRVATHIRKRGCKAGISINPATPTWMLSEILDCVDLVLIMSVNPGFGGQSFIPNTLKKIKSLRSMCDEAGVDPLIQIDGGVDASNAGEIAAAGANVLVAGSAIFGKEDRAAAIREMREAALRGCEVRA